jgi:hypothetical protein
MFDELRKRSYIYANTTEANGVGKDGRKRATTIARAKLGGDAGLYGAARLPMG